METEIKNIAQVIPGYSFRTALESNAKGDTFVLQAKNITDTAISHETDLIRIDQHIPRSSSYVRNDDLILMSRVAANSWFRSTVFKSSIHNVIASASVFIIRPDSTKVSSDYIRLYLSSDVGQERLSRITSGSHIRTLPRSKLECMLIPIPSLERQQILLDFHDKLQQLNSTFKRKIELYETILDSSLRNS